MTTSRKITMALSYLRSALDDLRVSSPMCASALSSCIFRVVEFRRIYSGLSDMGKCYNIHRSK